MEDNNESVNETGGRQDWLSVMPFETPRPDAQYRMGECVYVEKDHVSQASTSTRHEHRHPATPLQLPSGRP